MRYEIKFEIKEEDLKFFKGLLGCPAASSRIINRDIRILPIIEDINIEISINEEKGKRNDV